MNERDWLAERFEGNRAHMRAVAYRMLGSLSEADDAVQESWLRLSKSGVSGVENLDGWLTTVVARVCLDMLRSRRARREEPLDADLPELMGHADSGGPESEVLMADSVGLALLVVLDTLDPAERIAFVLHDMFDLPFDQIAPIVGRSAAAARQLASRARRRVHGAATVPDADVTRQREIVEAFFAAARGGDFAPLLAVLDPDVVVRADRVVAPAGVARVVRGARAVARQALRYSQGARFAHLVLVNGAVGAIVAEPGQPLGVMAFTFTGGKIAEIDLIAEPDRLRQLDLAVLGD